MLYLLDVAHQVRFNLTAKNDRTALIPQAFKDAPVVDFAMKESVGRAKMTYSAG